VGRMFWKEMLKTRVDGTAGSHIRNENSRMSKENKVFRFQQSCVGCLYGGLIEGVRMGQCWDVFTLNDPGSL